MRTYSIDKLQQEREKLNQMIEDALKRGIKIAENEEILKQSDLVEQLIEGMDKAQT